MIKEKKKMLKFEYNVYVLKASPCKNHCGTQ